MAYTGVLKAFPSEILELPKVSNSQLKETKPVVEQNQ